MLQVQEANVITNEDFKRAPCLQEGPISRSARSLVTAARRLGNDHRASHLRGCCVLNLFENSERIFASGEEPIYAFNLMLDKLSGMLNEAVDTNRDLKSEETSRLKTGGNGDRAPASAADVKKLLAITTAGCFVVFLIRHFGMNPFTC